MSLSRRSLSRFLVASCLLGVLTHGRVARAGRYVKFEILVDGQLAFTTHEEDEGTADADAVWRYLNYLDLTSAKGFKVKVDPKDPRRAVIRGKIVIQARYGGKVEVEELKLFRSREKDPWRIDRAEVQRTLGLRDVTEVID